MKYCVIKRFERGTSPVVHWLMPSTTRGASSIPGQGTKVLHVAKNLKKKKKKSCARAGDKQSMGMSAQLCDCN